MNEQMISKVGPTAELSLRVSVATLARVVFPHPEEGETMLALEHIATVLPEAGEARAAVKAQPFGGAVRIHDIASLQVHIGRFRFDSERSRVERDFRIFIKPADWIVVRSFCLEDFRLAQGSDLESDPGRELAEEFAATLGVELRPDQYVCKPIRTVFEDTPVPTGNMYAFGEPTVRVYRVFEALIRDSELIQAMLANSASHSVKILSQLALDDARNGGSGRANAMLVAPMERIRQAFLNGPAENRSTPLPFEDTLLDDNITAVLDGLTALENQ